MERRTHPQSVRAVLQRVHDIVRARPDWAARYEDTKRVVRAFRKPAFYEITQRCNIKCEGCYYFEGGLTEAVRENDSIAAWEEFFAAEARRNVTMAYFVGAEASLEQERLLAAGRHFPYGNVGTNGTIRIDSAVPYRIAVSVWAGDDATDRKLRGGPVFRKAFRNYAGDPRAIIHYTLSPWNLDGVRYIVEMCRDHDLPLTFNMYSPTASFLRKLRAGSANDDKFFRVSRPDHTPCFSAGDLIRARHLMADLMDEFPDTIVYSKRYNAWITEPGPRHALDPQTGFAAHCGSRIIGQMKYYGSDLSEMHPKCCSPDIDCSQCRMLSGGWSSKFQPGEDDVADERAFCDWLDMIGTLGRIFLYEEARPRSEIAREAAALVATA